MGRGGPTETFSFLELFPYSTPSWLKVISGVDWGGGGPCDYGDSPSLETTPGLVNKDKD